MPGERNIDGNLPTHASQYGRWQLIRDVLVFQGKLFLDGLRDVLLAPAALVTGLLAVIAPNATTERLFFDVLRLGTRLDGWINLFGALQRHRRRQELGVDAGDAEGIDALLDRVERLLEQLHARDGLTRQAKDRVDKVLDSIQLGKKD
jgi:hypothetical protein